MRPRDLPAASIKHSTSYWPEKLPPARKAAIEKCVAEQRAEMEEDRMEFVEHARTGE